MNPQTMLFVLIGSVVMFVIFMICKNEYLLSIPKVILGTLLLTIVGVGSVALLAAIESGHFGGVSFYGAVFFVPLLLFPAALIIKVDYKNYLDVAAPSVSGMLAVMKINCLIAGCCYGKVIGYADDNSPIRFPSQIVEGICAVIIMLVLVILLKKKKMANKLFPLFMVIYGVTRFILNLFRETVEVAFGMAFGNIWSIVAVIIGGIWIAIAIYREKHQKYKYY